MHKPGGSKDRLAVSRIKVGKAIRAKRLAVGLSLADLAGRVEVALSTMSKIENGKISVSFERLESISRALQADLSEIVGERAAGAIPPTGSSHFGMRRSISLPDQCPMIDAGSYLEWFHASEMLHKRYQPIVAELTIENVEDYGPFTQHSGEEFNYVLEGEMEFHSEIYAPVRLKAGASVYFDAEMKHAHVRVGKGRCRVLAILCPREEPDPEAVRNSLRVVDQQGGDAALSSFADSSGR